eukprot:647351-Rhodomonas_salina.2
MLASSAGVRARAAHDVGTVHLLCALPRAPHPLACQPCSLYEPRLHAPHLRPRRRAPRQRGLLNDPLIGIPEPFRSPQRPARLSLC